jgi:hypothetical protein
MATADSTARDLGQTVNVRITDTFVTSAGEGGAARINLQRLLQDASRDQAFLYLTAMSEGAEVREGLASRTMLPSLDGAILTKATINSASVTTPGGVDGAPRVYACSFMAHEDASGEGGDATEPRFSWPSACTTHDAGACHFVVMEGPGALECKAVEAFTPNPVFDTAAFGELMSQSPLTAFPKEDECMIVIVKHHRSVEWTAKTRKAREFAQIANMLDASIKVTVSAKNTKLSKVSVEESDMASLREAAGRFAWETQPFKLQKPTTISLVYHDAETNATTPAPVGTRLSLDMSMTFVWKTMDR